MAKLTVVLPWPARELSPNYTGKLRHKLRAKKQYRNDAFWLAKKALEAVTLSDLRQACDRDAITVGLTFCPPDRIRRDLDNFQASVKHGLDGIALALQIDDSHFRPVSDWGEKRKGGCVIVEIGE